MDKQAINPPQQQSGYQQSLGNYQHHDRPLRQDAQRSFEELAEAEAKVLPAATDRANIQKLTPALVLKKMYQEREQALQTIKDNPFQPAITAEISTPPNNTGTTKAQIAKLKRLIGHLQTQLQQLNQQATVAGTGFSAGTPLPNNSGERQVLTTRIGQLTTKLNALLTQL